MAITGAIKGTSQFKIYNKLGFESLKFRKWFSQLFVFYKIKTNQIPKYLYELLPTESHTYNARNIEMLKTTIAELMYLNTLSFHKWGG